jgi:hypothetical protein
MQSALVVNVGVGWGSYLLAALLGPRAPWLGLAAILVSAGNILMHTLVFNLRGRTWYNPGMLTAVVLFLPVAVYFFYLLAAGGLATPLDWVVGLVLGAILNYVGVLKVVDWMKDRNTPYIFPQRFMLPASRAGRDQPSAAR